jgi:hypothetical protein
MRIRLPHGAHRRREPEPPAADEHAVLALQRQLGNHAVARMLARKEPGPTVFGGKTVEKLDDAGWAADVRASKYFELIEGLAAQLDAQKLADVNATGGNVNGGRRIAFGELKPGLNFVRNFGSRGRTYYLHDGKADTLLPDTADGDEPQVAVVFSELAFDPDNEAYTLGVLRHELEHAVHYRMAADLLKSWRGGPKKQPFRAWLKTQSINASDRALVEERLAGATSGTEALANLEGFMAAFTTEHPGVTLADRPATEELADAAEYWLNAPKGVRAEVSARLSKYAAGLSGERRDTFVDKLKELKAAHPGLAELVDPLLKPRRR